MGLNYCVCRDRHVDPAGGGPGPHAHAHFQESFHVLEGEVEIKSELGAYTATKGTFGRIIWVSDLLVHLDHERKILQAACFVRNRDCFG